MPEYLTPGVYVEEIPSGSKPIEGVSTSTAAFLGATERGPETPYLITSWLEYQRWYGGLQNGYPDTLNLPYAVQGFFDNGGQRCYVARLTHQSASGQSEGGISKPILPDSLLQAAAIGRGPWGNNIVIKIVPASNAIKGTKTEKWFRVFVLYYRTFPNPFVDPTDPANLANKDRKTPDAFEDYDNLTFNPSATNSVVSVINSASQLIRVWWVDPKNAAPLNQSPTPQRLGDDAGAATPPIPLDAQDYAGSEDDRVFPTGVLPEAPKGRGLAALALIDEVAMLVAPDENQFPQNAVINQVIEQCQTLKDRFAIVSSPPNLPPTSPVLINPPLDTTFGAFYYPWIKIFDLSQNQTILVPPSGHVTGIIAATDINRGVHKAPANEVVFDATDLEFPISAAAQGSLNPKGVNCIRDFRVANRGIRLWGARTMSSDPEWKYINVRRLFLFLEKSIDHGTQWVVFEPNDEPLWAKVRRNISNFLVRVWKSGALMGATEAEAFFVKCDRTTMTQDDIDNGRLICYIGVAPVKPAEFVIFRISQKTADASQ
jgi:phage tail sheath protein FI